MKRGLSNQTLDSLQGMCEWERRVLHRQGSFSRIFRVAHKVTGIEEAVKEIQIEPEQLQRLSKRLVAYNGLSHQNIVKQDLIIDEDTNTAYISMPLFHKDLREIISAGPMSQDIIVEIMRDIISIMQAFASRDLVHGNLKPSNILMKKARKTYVSDHCMNTLYEKDPEEFNGLGIYSPPQMFLGKKSHCSKQDVWSLGMILYEMVFGYPPWPNRNVRSYKSFVIKYPLAFPHDTTISENLKDLIKKCLVVDDSNRMPWKRILDHPLVSHQMLSHPSEPIKMERKVIDLLMRIQMEIIKKNKSVKRIFGEIADKIFDFENFTEVCLEMNNNLTSQQIAELFKSLRTNKGSYDNWNTIKKDLLEIDYRNASNFASRFIKELAEIISQKGIETSEIRKKLEVPGSTTVSYQTFRATILYLLPYIHQSELMGIWKRVEKQFQKKVLCDSILGELKISLLKKNSLTEEQKVRQELNRFKNSFQPFGNCTIKQVVEFFDTNNDKKISFLEFREMVKSFFMQLAEPELKAMFDKIDRDQSGLISGDELRQFLKTQ